MKTAIDTRFIVASVQLCLFFITENHKPTCCAVIHGTTTCCAVIHEKMEDQLSRSSGNIGGSQGPV